MFPLCALLQCVLFCFGASKPLVSGSVRGVSPHIGIPGGLYFGATKPLASRCYVGWSHKLEVIGATSSTVRFNLCVQASASSSKYSTTPRQLVHVEYSSWTRAFKHKQAVLLLCDRTSWLAVNPIRSLRDRRRMRWRKVKKQTRRRRRSADILGDICACLVRYRKNEPGPWFRNVLWIRPLVRRAALYGQTIHARLHRRARAGARAGDFR